MCTCICSLCSIACALYAHFGPGKFPANWDSVYYCVVAYVVLTVVLNIFCFFKEGDSFLITHPKLVGGNGQGALSQQILRLLGWIIRSALFRGGCMRSTMLVSNQLT